MEIKNTSSKFTIKKNNSKINFKSFDVLHGSVKTRGYLFNNVAYISDCKEIPKKNVDILKKLNVLIIDCFRINKHITHLDLNATINLIQKLKPKKAILLTINVKKMFFIFIALYYNI